MKLTGAVMCVAAFLAAGICRYQSEKKRLAALRTLSQAFTAMGSELSASLAPLPKLLKIRAGGFAAEFLEKTWQGMEHLGQTDMERIWSEALELCPPLLREDEKNLVKALGTVLGRCTLEVQLKALSDTADRLDERAEELRHGLPTVRKLSFGLSAALGLLMTILLM